jgi:hypothetical protein
MSKISIFAAAALCLIPFALQATAQSSSTNYILTSGGPVGGGGSSTEPDFSVVGSIPLVGSGVSIDNNYAVSGGIIGSIISGSMLSALYTGDAVMTVPAGVNRTLTINITKGGGVDTSGSFYYRLGGATVYNSANMAVGVATLTYSLSGTLINIRGLEYYFKVKIDTDSMFIGNPSAPFVFIASMSNEQAQRPAALPNAQYRIVGVPINTASHSLSAVFEDDLGAYDPTKWRLGSYRAALDSVVEFPNADQVYPGQGYWLIARGTKKYGSSGTSVRPNDVVGGQDYYRVDLDAGWNQLADPFPFNVAWDDIMFDDNGTIVAHDPSVLEDMAYWYSGSQYVTYDHIPAWEGVFVNIKKSGVAALIPFREASTPKQQPDLPPESPESGWAVNLMLEVNGLIDDNNLAGVRSDASTGYDHYDFCEPPSPPGGPILAFRLPEETRGLKRTDIRPPFDDGACWRISFLRADGGRLTVNGIDRIPTGMEAWLMIGKAATVRLFEGTTIELPENPAEADLIIGTAQYAAAVTQDILPLTFALDQNYPNPFNPLTNISFSLVEEGPANLKIFNVLGQTIRVLVDAHLPAGHYILQWHGDDQSGNPVASGIYFYRLEQGKESLYRKMILIK